MALIGLMGQGRVETFAQTVLLPPLVAAGRIDGIGGSIGSARVGMGFARHVMTTCDPCLGFGFVRRAFSATAMRGNAPHKLDRKWRHDVLATVITASDSEPEVRMPHRTDPLDILDQAIARAGGAKVMLRLDEAQTIRAALKAAPTSGGAKDLMRKVQGRAKE